MNLLDYFNAEFEKALQNRGVKTYEDTFDEVNESFAEKHGFEAFNSYDSFRKKRAREKWPKRPQENK